MRESKVLAAFVIAGLALVLVAVGTSSASADESSIGRSTAPLAPVATIVVTSTADSGPGTLRQALLDAANGDTITFDATVFPQSNPQTITVASGLPSLTQGNLTISGSGAGVILYGGGTVPDCFYVTSNGNMIKGLQILYFANYGIQLASGASSNLIGGNNADPGGSCSGDCNLISGNGMGGVVIDGSSTMANTVSGNCIGTNISGTLAIPNGGQGVTVNGPYNIIGGDTPQERNLISGNSQDGIGVGGDHNTISGNYIGTDVTGSQALPNRDGAGIQICCGASVNLVGGDTPGERNVISGNYDDDEVVGHGVWIFGSGTMSNTVSGNYIGTDASGTTAIPNRDKGVDISMGAQHNVVGGPTAGERNLISGNGGRGVSLAGSHNVAIGNYIGTDPSGTAAIGNAGGVAIYGDYITLGGDTPGERNLISGNSGSGIEVGGDHNTISGNYIGTDVSGAAALANGGSGVYVWNGAQRNTIGFSNIIAFNDPFGVLVDGSSTLSNTITRNSIFSNSDRGIGLDSGGNAELAAPVFTSYDVLAGTAGGTACANCTVEVFSDQADEGRTFEGSTVADGSGNWNLNKGGAFTGPKLTATATDTGGNTSDFSMSVTDAHVVTSAADSGPGTLRQALLDAGNGDTISFDTNVFSATNPATITLSSGLPAIAVDNLTIDGSNAGVILDGSALGDENGFTLTSDGNVIQGLQILNFEKGILVWQGASNNTIGGVNNSPGAACTGACNLISSNSVGILIDGEDTMSNTVNGNYIGVDISGTVAMGNANGGIDIRNGASHNIIGGMTPGERNIISGNGGQGISIRAKGIVTAAHHNTVSGNYIGTDASGAIAIPNADSGIYVGAGASYNTIGGENAAPGGACSGACNVISGSSDNDGVRISDDGTMHNTVSGNYIGTDVGGTTDLGNDEGGVVIMNSASHNLVGGDTAAERNLISGNNANAVVLEGGAAHNTVSGNYIGTDADGAGAIPNANSGVYVGDAVFNNTIGGSNSTPGGNCTGECNLISGNGGYGIAIQDGGTMSNTVSGNYIGTDVDGTTAIPNSSGIVISNGDHNIVGGNTAGERNLVSGNTDPGDYSAGVWIVGGDYNTVIGNYIGTDASGTTALANGNGAGVSISDGAAYNVIGGDSTGERNLISGNDGVGVQMLFTVTQNTVSGNYIGTDISGTGALSNTGGGVQIGRGSHHNVIGGDDAIPGGTCSGECNLISGNAGDGIVVHNPGSDHNVVRGNHIGTNATGTASLGNDQEGIDIYDGASYTTVGGDTSGERNLISGNGGSGILIRDGDTVSNTVSGNYIGTDTAGSSAISNTGDGVSIDHGASYNLIGGDTPGERNLISGNGGGMGNAGVWIGGNGTMYNVVSGNYIGTDVSGTMPIGNDQMGIFISDGAHHNVAGGSAPGERNLISANVYDGVVISVGNDNTISGNYIGTDASGMVTLGNGERGVGINGGGVDLDAARNLVEDNLISGNGLNGIDLYGAGTVSNTISGNYIGTNISGTTAISNTNNGIYIGGGADNNLIGGDAPGKRNLISGNGKVGVSISGSGTMSNTVSGNAIGTDTGGTAALPNTETGVWIGNAAQSNTVEGNLISGNGCNGAGLDGGDTTGNVFRGNLVGTDVTGKLAVPNGCQGIWIGHGARHNTIGGTAAQDRNIISGNSWGVGIEGDGTTENVVLGNFIGIDISGTAALGNNNAGVVLYGNSQRSTIGPGNIIAHNSTDGVIVYGSACVSNTITQNSIHSNAGLGIDLVDGGNAELAPPAITQLTPGGTVAGTTCAGCTVEIFSDDAEEGRIYEGSTSANGAGQFSFTKAGGFIGPNVTATATDAGGNTSEFSSPMSPMSISQVMPDQGTNDVPNTINVYGVGFGTGVSVTLDTTPNTDLATLRLSDTHLRATVPAGLSAGTYNLTVTNPDGGSSTLVGAYTVFDASAAYDDLYAQSYDLWRNPLAAREGTQVDLGLVVHRQGGTATLASVVVRFYDGDPDSGGIPIGDGAIYFLSPDGSESTTGVPWTPAAAGDYDIYARIDPAGAISETIETNNTISTTVTILPTAVDTTPPTVTALSIDGGAVTTDVPTVTLSVTAEDNVGGSGVSTVFFVEFEYVQAAGQWVPVQASGWLTYTGSYTWTLTPVAGVRYIQAWAADKAGNISLSAYKDHINYTPPGDRVEEGEIRVYRQYLQVGQSMTVTITPAWGDVDLYVWGPTGDSIVYSINSTGVDQVSFVAAQSGTYQIETHGYSAAQYTVTVVVGEGGSGLAPKAQADSTSLEKTPRSTPVLAPDDEPPGQVSIPHAPVTGDESRVYLPLILR